jgi:hypothetical protein
MQSLVSIPPKWLSDCSTYPDVSGKHKTFTARSVTQFARYGLFGNHVEAPCMLSEIPYMAYLFFIEPRSTISRAMFVSKFSSFLMHSIRASNFSPKMREAALFLDQYCIGIAVWSHIEECRTQNPLGRDALTACSMGLLCLKDSPSRVHVLTFQLSMSAIFLAKAYSTDTSAHLLIVAAGITLLCGSISFVHQTPLVNWLSLHNHVIWHYATSIAMVLATAAAKRVKGNTPIAPVETQKKQLVEQILYSSAVFGFVIRAFGSNHSALLHHSVITLFAGYHIWRGIGRNWWAPENGSFPLEDRHYLPSAWSFAYLIVDGIDSVRLRNWPMVLHHLIFASMLPTQSAEYRFLPYGAYLWFTEISSVVMSVCSIRYGSMQKAPSYMKLLFVGLFLVARIAMHALYAYPRMITRGLLKARDSNVSDVEYAFLLRLCGGSTLMAVLNTYWATKLLRSAWRMTSM